MRLIRRCRGRRAKGIDRRIQWTRAIHEITRQLEPQIRRWDDRVATHGLPYTINCGWCYDLSDELERRFPEGFALSSEHALVNPRWFPYSLDKKDVAVLEEIPHGWFYLQGLHFDSEAPHGVQDWRELPVYRRNFNTLGGRRAVGKVPPRWPRTGPRTWTRGPYQITADFPAPSNNELRLTLQRDGQRVGHLIVAVTSRGDRASGFVASSAVEEGLRRQGLGTALYVAAREALGLLEGRDPDSVHLCSSADASSFPEDTTPEAGALWRSLRRRGLVQ